MKGSWWTTALAPLILSVFTGACRQPVSQETFSNSTDFATLYRDNCSGCHGAEGKHGPGRQLNDSLYLALIPKEELRHTIENGRPGTAMPAFSTAQGGPLSPAQVDALVGGIRQNWARPVDFHGVTPPPYLPGSAGDSMNGKGLFARSCAPCHGPHARVGLVNTPDYLNLVSDQWLRSSILAGRSDLGMPDWRHLKAGRPLTDNDVADLTAYLVSFRPSNSNLFGGTNRTQDSGTGDVGGSPMTKGNEGSGNGPGSPNRTSQEGNQTGGSSSTSGGPGGSGNKTGAEKAPLRSK